ncbi:hypothetical protein CIHG_01624 [Coccidioides immitis H538.4]|uniref:Uncharacterized protein n=2 Tax=Coccidioides immitis TaxID=5501 RepID=A0A0J8RC83_COCIT|nr:hypothetical protein CISG_09178 [Coccidioides immitis RMSCC 3703]KMU83840.1 hypothetical protein CIHG_01624 [Coccidioides immitis H538.4]
MARQKVAFFSGLRRNSYIYLEKCALRGIWFVSANSPLARISKSLQDELPFQRLSALSTKVDEPRGSASKRSLVNSVVFTARMELVHVNERKVAGLSNILEKPQNFRTGKPLQRIFIAELTTKEATRNQNGPLSTQG